MDERGLTWLACLKLGRMILGTLLAVGSVFF